MSRLECAFVAVAADWSGHLDNEKRIESLGLDVDEFLAAAIKMVRFAHVRAPSLADVELFTLGVEIGRELMREEWEEATRGDR